MIGTAPKPREEILAALRGVESVFVIGCVACATAFHTGGEPEVAAMAAFLEQSGFRVEGSGSPEVRTCDITRASDFLSRNREQVGRAGAILVLACGGATQIVGLAAERLGLFMPVYTGANTIGHMDTMAPSAEYWEDCSDCGDCLLNFTGGICPVTRCAKGLLNGPCGGASSDGRCEANPDRECAWAMIYRRLQSLGQLDRLREYREPKHFARVAHPRRLLYGQEAGHRLV